MKKIKKLLQSTFAKNVALISGGTAIAQILGTVFSTIITRIYSPEEYGVLIAYTSILGMLAISGSLKYEYAIPISKNDKKAINVFALSFLILIIFSLIIGLIFLFFGNFILPIFNAENLLEYNYLVPIGIFVGLYSIVIQWTFRKKDYKSISKTKLTQSIAQNSTQIGLWLIGLGPIGLILDRI